MAVQKPDGVSTTTYSYQGNKVTVTDPAGNWKNYYSDALGHLIQVEEPNRLAAPITKRITPTTFSIT